MYVLETYLRSFFDHFIYGFNKSGDAMRIADNTISLPLQKGGKVIKVISIITIIAFLTTSLGIDVALAVPTNSSNPYKTSEIKTLDLNTFMLPKNLGTVQGKWGSFERAATVIHIQDAHCNYSAQKQISRILAYLSETYGIRAVNLEGGSGEYDFSVFADIENSKTREGVADYFVDQGIVSGSEFYAINNPSSVDLWGVEDIELYLKSLNIYKDSLRDEKRIEEFLISLSDALSLLKMRMFTEELLEMDSKFVSYKEGDLLFKEYLEFVVEKARDKDIQIIDFKNIVLLEEALSEEANIDFERAEEERGMLIDRIQRMLSQRQLEDLVIKTIEFESKVIDQDDFYNYLFQKADVLKIDLTFYSELVKYNEYISIYANVDSGQITNELEELDEIVRGLMFENEAQEELYMFSKNLILMKNIFDLELKKSDYEYYKENKSSFDIGKFISFIEEQGDLYGIDSELPNEMEEINAYREDLEEFFEYSFERDEAFLENIKFGELETNQGQAAVLVTGGFHSENLCEMFKEKGISYISIMPKFTCPEGYESPYFELLSGRGRTVQPLLAEVSLLALYSDFSQNASRIYGEDAIKAKELWIKLVAAIYEHKTDIQVGDRLYSFEETAEFSAVEGVVIENVQIYAKNVGGDDISVPMEEGNVATEPTSGVQKAIAARREFLRRSIRKIRYFCVTVIAGAVISIGTMGCSVFNYTVKSTGLLSIAKTVDNTYISLKYSMRTNEMEGLSKEEAREKLHRWEDSHGNEIRRKAEQMQSGVSPEDQDKEYDKIDAKYIDEFLSWRDIGIEIVIQELARERFRLHSRRFAYTVLNRSIQIHGGKEAVKRLVPVVKRDLLEWGGSCPAEIWDILGTMIATAGVDTKTRQQIVEYAIEAITDFPDRLKYAHKALKWAIKNFFVNIPKGDSRTDFIRYMFVNRLQEVFMKTVSPKKILLIYDDPTFALLTNNMHITNQYSIALSIELTFKRFGRTLDFEIIKELLPFIMKIREKSMDRVLLDEDTSLIIVCHEEDQFDISKMEKFARKFKDSDIKKFKGVQNSDKNRKIAEDILDAIAKAPENTTTWMNGHGREKSFGIASEKVDKKTGEVVYESEDISDEELADAFIRRVKIDPATSMKYLDLYEMSLIMGSCWAADMSIDNFLNTLSGKCRQQGIEIRSLPLIVAETGRGSKESKGVFLEGILNASRNNEKWKLLDIFNAEKETAIRPPSSSYLYNDSSDPAVFMPLTEQEFQELKTIMGEPASSAGTVPGMLISARDPIMELDSAFKISYELAGKGVEQNIFPPGIFGVNAKEEISQKHISGVVPTMAGLDLMGKFIEIVPLSFSSETGKLVGRLQHIDTGKILDFSVVEPEPKLVSKETLQVKIEELKKFIDGADISSEERRLIESIIYSFSQNMPDHTIFTDAGIEGFFGAGKESFLVIDRKLMEGSSLALLHEIIEYIKHTNPDIVKRMGRLLDDSENNPYAGRIWLKSHEEKYRLQGKEAYFYTDREQQIIRDHYIIRAFTRQVFGEEDEKLTRIIKEGGIKGEIDGEVTIKLKPEEKKTLTFENEVWVNAGDFWYKIWVEQDEAGKDGVKFQRYNIKDGRPVGGINDYLTRTWISVGKSLDNDYSINDTVLSKKHFKFLVRSKDGIKTLEIEDRGSTNGTEATYTPVKADDGDTQEVTFKLKPKIMKFIDFENEVWVNAGDFWYKIWVEQDETGTDRVKFRRYNAKDGKAVGDFNVYSTGTPVSVGKADDNSYSIDDPSLSEKHFQFSVRCEGERKKLGIKDLESSHGTVIVYSGLASENRLSLLMKQEQRGSRIPKREEEEKEKNQEEPKKEVTDGADLEKGVLWFVADAVYWLMNLLGIKRTALRDNIVEDAVVPVVEEGGMFLGLVFGSPLLYVGIRLSFIILHAFQDRAPPAGRDRTLFEKTAFPALASSAAIIPLAILGTTSIGLISVAVMGTIVHMLANKYVTGSSLQKAALDFKESNEGDDEALLSEKEAISLEIGVSGINLLENKNVQEQLLNGSYRGHFHSYQLPENAGEDFNVFVRSLLIDAMNDKSVFDERERAVLDVLMSEDKNSIDRIRSKVKDRLEGMYERVEKIESVINEVLRDEGLNLEEMFGKLLTFYVDNPKGLPTSMIVKELSLISDLMLLQVYPDDVPVYRGIDRKYAGMSGKDDYVSDWGVGEDGIGVAANYANISMEMGGDNLVIIQTSFGELRQKGIIIPEYKAATGNAISFIHAKGDDGDYLDLEYEEYGKLASESSDEVEKEAEVINALGTELLSRDFKVRYKAKVPGRVYGMATQSDRIEKEINKLIAEAKYVDTNIIDGDVISNAVDGIFLRFDNEFMEYDDQDIMQYEDENGVNITGSITLKILRNNETGEISIIVSDNGSGIPHDIMKNWRDKFESTKAVIPDDGEDVYAADVKDFFFIGGRNQGINKILSKASDEKYKLSYISKVDSDQGVALRFTQEKSGAVSEDMLKKEEQGTTLIVTMPAEVSVEVEEMINLETEKTMYDTAQKLVPEIVNLINRDAPTYDIAPADYEGQSKVIDMLNQAKRRTGRKGHNINAAFYTFGAGEDWVNKLEKKINANLDKFYLDLKEKSTTRMTIRLLEGNDKRSEVKDLIIGKLTKIISDFEKIDSEKARIAATEIFDGKILLIGEYVEGAEHLNNVIDLFADIAMMEVHRYQKGDYLEESMPDSLKSNLAGLLRSSVMNLEGLTVKNIAEVLEQIFNGRIILEMRKVNWESIRQWKAANDSVLVAL